MAKTQQEYRTIPRSQQVRQRKEQAFEGIEENEYAVDPQNGLEVSINKRRESCRLRRHRHRPQIANATVGRQEVGILGYLHGLTIRLFFSELEPVSVGGEVNFPTTDGWCGENSHSHDIFVHVKLIKASSAQVQSLTTRTRVAQIRHGSRPTRLRMVHRGVS